MENYKRTQGQETAITATKAVFGTIHLVLDVLATATCMAEAEIIKKIDPLTPETREELIEQRRVKSMGVRTEIINKIDAKRKELEAKMQAKNVSPSVVTN